MFTHVTHAPATADARPQGRPDYYGGFLLDPEGNSTEAVHHGDTRRVGTSTTCGAGCAT